MARRAALLAILVGCGGAPPAPAPAPAPAPPALEPPPATREVSILYSNITMLEDGTPTEWTIELGTIVAIADADRIGADGIGLEPAVMASCAAAKGEMLDELYERCPGGVGATDAAASACECVRDDEDGVACYTHADLRCARDGDDPLAVGAATSNAQAPAASAATRDVHERCAALGREVAALDVSCLCDDELHADTGACACVASATCVHGA